MFITITHDPDADFSFFSAQEQARGVVALEMLVYPDQDHYGIPLASLCNITFYEDGGDWTTGEFRSVEEIPAGCDHLREVARQLLEEAGGAIVAPATPVERGIEMLDKLHAEMTDATHYGDYDDICQRIGTIVAVLKGEHNPDEEG